jgi:hypothetical protein
VGGAQLYPRANCLDRDQALRMWTENVTWFSNEEGNKGRIAAGQLADLIVPDRDFFNCPESDIADTTSLFTMVGGKVVYATGPFSDYDQAPPPAMPDWSPVRQYGGYAAWGRKPAQGASAAAGAKAASACGCAHSCQVHGHRHATAWASKIPVADLKEFWGALGCACWAVW